MSRGNRGSWGAAIPGDPDYMTDTKATDPREQCEARSPSPYDPLHQRCALPAGHDGEHARIAPAIAIAAKPLPESVQAAMDWLHDAAERCVDLGHTHAAWACIKEPAEAIAEAARQEQEAELNRALEGSSIAEHRRLTAEAKIATLTGAIRELLDATDAHRTDGKNTRPALERARDQARAALGQEGQ